MYLGFGGGLLGIFDEADFILRFWIFDDAMEYSIENVEHE